ncbi:hypothetical protein KHA90_20505 [Flavobacterium psychroterrae]|uniref:Uncharacterized protein n=1 Tax=Flavobacterium psychroterrae TaxID=2133767 RepID=A0ABS5PGY9_9FLAO|nr:hypothetical protein [Flavobacterium psychroterrae]
MNFWPQIISFHKLQSAQGTSFFLLLLLQYALYNLQAEPRYIAS